MRVAVLIDQSETRQDLRRILGARSGPPPTVRLRFLFSWGEVHEGGTRGAYELAIVQPSFGQPAQDSPPNLPELERLASAGNAEQVVLSLSGPGPATDLLSDLARLGFPFLLGQDEGDYERHVLRVVARAETRRKLRRRLEGLENRLDEETLRLVLDTTTTWPPARSVEEFARRLRMSRRTLQRRLRQKGLPSPGKLISIARLLEACALWRDAGIQNRTRIGFILGMADPASLGHLSRSLANRPFREFLDPGSAFDPLEWLMGEFGR